MRYSNKESLHFNYELVSAVESAPDDSSECTRTFEVEINGALEVTTEFHLKMCIVVRKSVQKEFTKQFNKRCGGI